jgi:Ca2+-binding RTX toxin-like protein
MAVTAFFNKTTGILTVFGDVDVNTINVGRDAAGTILVNGGAVPVSGSTATVANTLQIQVFGLDGADSITIDEANGAMPAAELFGGPGNDVMTGGSGADQLFGQAGNDRLLGKGGNDLLFGGDGNDTLIGGAGNDQVFGEAGDDRMIWNPGDGSDLFEGGDGTDTADVNGGNGSETFTITANGSRVRFNRIDPAPFAIDIGTTENLVVNANGGDDVITAGNGLSGLIKLTIDGGAGNDTITGGDGDDTLLGGDGNDVVTGGRGADAAMLGNGDDTFIWNPGDGSDTVDGQAGFDTLLFNGANIAEKIGITANGGHVSFTRDVANIAMDLNHIERIAFTARGGADNITVGDLSATDVQQIDLDLSATSGSGMGDGQADTVTLNASGRANHISVTNSGATITVTGLPGQVTIDGADSGIDSLIINALGGNDTIDASLLRGNPINLTIDGGDGNDTILGGDGNDTLLGGAGNDVVTGGRGNDVALLGDGNDTFIWNPGDGSDTVEGESGTDTLQFNGSNASEKIDISANGSRVQFFRDVGAISMDLNGVEHIQFAASGGADSITVNDLTGTGVTQVAIDLAASGTTLGDGAPDRVTVEGTAGDDVIKITSKGGDVTVNGLTEKVTISHAEADQDTLTVNGLGGNNTIDASALMPGQINLVINSGDGNDTITGSAGNDVISGGRGADTAFMGTGDDTFIWNPGDGNDTVEGQGGIDTLQFNGANIAENIDISANASRVRFFRDVANINMDLNGVEHIRFTALGGADTITVNDLTGTDTNQVAIDLAGTPGGSTGDGAQDTIVINGTGADDVITVSAANGVVTVSGLAETVTIANFEPTDRLVINGLGGDDVINASGLNGAMQLFANGGDGADVLIGSPGNETLSGGAGDDVLIGGGGQDVLDGGTGNNVVINSATVLGAPTMRFMSGDDMSPAGDVDAGGFTIAQLGEIAAMMPMNGFGDPVGTVSRFGSDVMPDGGANAIGGLTIDQTMPFPVVATHGVGFS